MSKDVCVYVLRTEKQMLIESHWWLEHLVLTSTAPLCLSTLFLQFLTPTFLNVPHRCSEIPGVLGLDPARPEDCV